MRIVITENMSNDFLDLITGKINTDKNVIERIVVIKANVMFIFYNLSKMYLIITSRTCKAFETFHDFGTFSEL